jgi:hypothetical protein
LAVICDEAFRCKGITGRLLSLARSGNEARTQVCLPDIAEDVVSSIGGLPKYADRRIILGSSGSSDELRLHACEGEMRPLREIELSLDRGRRRIVHRAKPINSIESTDASPREGTTLWEAERQQILAALERHGGNRTAAAEALGISRRTLHYRINEYRSLGRWPPEECSD